VNGKHDRFCGGCGVSICAPKPVAPPLYSKQESTIPIDIITDSLT
jgi:hypothetical protein